MSELLAIKRPLLLEGHEALLAHAPQTETDLGDTRLKWRELGEAGLTLVSQWMYERAISQRRSKLATVGAASVAQSLNSVINRMPTEPHNLDLDVIGCDFFGGGEFLSVAYLLKPARPTQEHSRLTSLLDRMNGINTYWGENFVPHLSVATVAARNANQGVLDVFQSIAPASFSFERVVAVPDGAPDP